MFGLVLNVLFIFLLFTLLVIARIAQAFHVKLVYHTSFFLGVAFIDIFVSLRIFVILYAKIKL